MVQTSLNQVSVHQAGLPVFFQVLDVAALLLWDHSVSDFYDEIYSKC